MIEHISPDFVLNALRFLLEGYKVARDRFKDKKTPDRVEEIVTRAAQGPKSDATQIERSIAKDLDPVDAAIVAGDIQLLSLLMVPPPSSDAFDYWSKLSQLVTGLQSFANRNRLFELRGVVLPALGEALYLRRTSKVLMPKKMLQTCQLLIRGRAWKM